MSYPGTIIKFSYHPQTAHHQGLVHPAGWVSWWTGLIGICASQIPRWRRRTNHRPSIVPTHPTRKESKTHTKHAQINALTLRSVDSFETPSCLGNCLSECHRLYNVILLVIHISSPPSPPSEFPFIRSFSTKRKGEL